MVAFKGYVPWWTHGNCRGDKSLAMKLSLAYTHYPMQYLCKRHQGNCLQLPEVHGAPEGERNVEALIPDDAWRHQDGMHALIREFLRWQWVFEARGHASVVIR